MIKDFIAMVFSSIARGFGFTIGRDIADIAVHKVEDEFTGR